MSGLFGILELVRETPRPQPSRALLDSGVFEPFDTHTLTDMGATSDEVLRPWVDAGLARTAHITTWITWRRFITPEQVARWLSLVPEFLFPDRPHVVLLTRHGVTTEDYLRLMDAAGAAQARNLRSATTAAPLVGLVSRTMDQVTLMLAYGMSWATARDWVVSGRFWDRTDVAYADIVAWAIEHPGVRIGTDDGAPLPADLRRLYDRFPGEHGPAAWQLGMTVTEYEAILEGPDGPRHLAVLTALGPHR